jgi:negative regulator of sigma E activity
MRKKDGGDMTGDHDAMRQTISAMVDGAVSRSEMDAALTHLNDEDYLTWRLYHRISDVLQADSQEAVLSPLFEARLQARLAQEVGDVAVGGIVSPVSRARRIGGWLTGWMTTTVAGMNVPALCAAAMLLVISLGVSVGYDASRAIAPDALAVAEPQQTADVQDRLEDYVAAHRCMSPALYSEIETCDTDVVVAGNN